MYNKIQTRRARKQFAAGDWKISRLLYHAIVSRNTLLIRLGFKRSDTAENILNFRSCKHLFTTLFCRR